MREAEHFHRQDETEHRRLNVDDLPLDIVLRHDDSALDNALLHLLRGLDRPGENYAAHGSTP